MTAHLLQVQNGKSEKQKAGKKAKNNFVFQSDLTFWGIEAQLTSLKCLAWAGGELSLSLFTKISMVNCSDTTKSKHQAFY